MKKIIIAFVLLFVTDAYAQIPGCDGVVFGDGAKFSWTSTLPEISAVLTNRSRDKFYRYKIVRKNDSMVELCDMDKVSIDGLEIVKGVSGILEVVGWFAMDAWITKNRDESDVVAMFASDSDSITWCKDGFVYNKSAKLFEKSCSEGTVLIEKKRPVLDRKTRLWAQRTVFHFEPIKKTR